MQSVLLGQLVSMVVADLFGPAMFLQQTAPMELVGSKVAAHFQAVWTQIFKLAAAAADQVETASMQFLQMVVLAVLVFQIP
jgi:hypothetical protein